MTPSLTTHPVVGDVVWFYATDMPPYETPPYGIIQGVTIPPGDEPWYFITTAVGAKSHRASEFQVIHFALGDGAA